MLGLGWGQEEERHLPWWASAWREVVWCPGQAVVPVQMLVLVEEGAGRVEGCTRKHKGVTSHGNL